jgi:hypothetical protein
MRTIDAVLLKLVKDSQGLSGQELEQSLDKIINLINNHGANPNAYWVEPISGFQKKTGPNASTILLSPDLSSPEFLAPALDYAVGNEKLVMLLLGQDPDRRIENIEAVAKRVRNPHRLVKQHGSLIRDLDLTPLLPKYDPDGNIHVTDVTLREITEHCPNIQRLNISGCSLITVNGLKEFGRKKEKTPDLQIILMSSADAIDKLNPIYATKKSEEVASVSFWQDIGQLRAGSRKENNGAGDIIEIPKTGTTVGITQITLTHEMLEKIQKQTGYTDNIANHEHITSVVIQEPENFSEKDKRVVASLLSRMPHLQNLRIKGGLDQNAIGFLVDPIQKSETLHSLSFRSTSNKKVDLAVVQQMLINPKIHNLALQYCNLTLQDRDAIAELIGKSHLHVLDLTGNPVSKEPNLYHIENGDLPKEKQKANPVPEPSAQIEAAIAKRKDFTDLRGITSKTLEERRPKTLAMPNYDDPLWEGHSQYDIQQAVSEPITNAIEEQAEKKILSIPPAHGFDMLVGGFVWDIDSNKEASKLQEAEMAGHLAVQRSRLVKLLRNFAKDDKEKPSKPSYNSISNANTFKQDNLHIVSRHFQEQAGTLLDGLRFPMQVHRLLQSNPNFRTFSEAFASFFYAHYLGAAIRVQNPSCEVKFEAPLAFMNHSDKIIAFFNGGDSKEKNGHYSTVSVLGDRACSISELVPFFLALTETQQDIISSFESKEAVTKYVSSLGNNLLDMIYDGTITPAHTVEETAQIAALALSASRDVVKQRQKVTRNGEITLSELRDEMFTQFENLGIQLGKILAVQKEMNQRLGTIESSLKKERTARERDFQKLLSEMQEDRSISDATKKEMTEHVETLKTQLHEDFEKSFKLTKENTKKLEKFQDAVAKPEQKAELLFPGDDGISKFQRAMYQRMMDTAKKCAEVASGKAPEDKIDGIMQEVGKAAGTYIPLPGAGLVASIVVGIAGAAKKKYQKDQASRKMHTGFDKAVEEVVRKIGLIYPQIEAIADGSIDTAAKIAVALIMQHLTNHNIDKYLDAYKNQKSEQPTAKHLANVMLAGLMWPQGEKTSWMFWKNGTVSWYKGMESLHLKDESLFMKTGNKLLNWGLKTGEKKAKDADLTAALKPFKLSEETTTFFQETALPFVFEKLGETITTQINNHVFKAWTAEAMFAHPVFVVCDKEGKPSARELYHQNKDDEKQKGGANKYGFALLEADTYSTMRALQASLHPVTVPTITFDPKAITAFAELRQNRMTVEKEAKKTADKPEEALVGYKKVTAEHAELSTIQRHEAAIQKTFVNLYTTAKSQTKKSVLSPIEVSDEGILLRVSQKTSQTHVDRLKAAGLEVTSKDHQKSYTTLVVKELSQTTLLKAKTTEEAVKEAGGQCVIL